MRQRGIEKGMAVYLALVFALAWAPTFLLRELWHTGEQALATRLLLCSVAYAVTMGWQPIFAVLVVRRLVEDIEYLDAGLRAARGRFVLAALVLAGLLCACASALALVQARFVPPAGVQAAIVPGAGAALFSAFSAATAILFIWLQCLSEEIGWRGYLLSRAMQLFGPRPGLVLHGVAWGVWYAPIFLLTNGELVETAPRAGAFVLTCVLLGTVLGWLRLASKSIVPPTILNSLLTIAAGLPFLMQGVDVGLRGAVYEPAGWLPLLLLVLALCATRLKRVIVTPRPPSIVRSSFGRTLH
jgi:membrane protease YdiL (CAAX protease family)